MEKIEEIKAKVLTLVDEAYESGAADKAAECEKRVADKVAEYENKLDEAVREVNQKMSEAVKEAEARGYEQGRSDALKEQTQEGMTEPNPEPTPEPEPEPNPEPTPEPEPDPTPEYSLVNEAVSAYMADTTYDAPGFATSDGQSVVSSYAGPNMVEGDYVRNWQEHPRAVVLPSGRTVRNLVPGREYTKDGYRFRTSMGVRMIDFGEDKPVANCRDLGGYACEGGRTVRYGRVIRSAKLPSDLTISSETAKILREEVGVTLEIDLRGSFAYSTLGWNGVKLGIYGYATALTKTTRLKDVFTRILTEIQSGGCVLIHCSAGADRSGTVAALLLGVLGVSMADIIRDWELTSFCHWCNFKEIGQWEKRLADPKMKAIALKEFPTGELREFFRKMAATYGKNGETFQQQCRAFLTGKGILTAAQIDSLRDEMTE